MRELYCPKCEEPTEMLLSLGTGDEVTCNTCGTVHKLDDIRKLVNMVRQWERVLAWVETMPK